MTRTTSLHKENKVRKMSKLCSFDEAHPWLRLSLTAFGLSVLKQDKLTNMYDISTLKYVPVAFSIAAYSLLACTVAQQVTQLGFNGTFIILPLLFTCIFSGYINFQSIISANIEKQMYQALEQTFRKRTNQVANFLQYFKWVGGFLAMHLILYCINASSFVFPYILSVSFAILWYYISTLVQDHHFQLMIRQLVRRTRFTTKFIRRIVTLGNEKATMSHLSILLSDIRRRQEESVLFEKVSK